jgi:hypothetical protein
LAAIEAALAWLLAYPLLPLQLLLLLLIAWGGLGKSLGFEALFWHEQPGIQFLNGLASGWLFGEILLVRYLLDPGRDRFVLPVSLFPCQEQTVRRLGEFLLVAWPASLLPLGALRLVMAGLGHNDLPVPIWPMFAGFAASVLVTAGLVCVNEWSGLRSWVQGTRLFRAMPGVAFGYLKTAEYPLHALALELAVLFLAGATAAVLVGTIIPPVVLLCLLLGTFNAAYGFVAFQLRGLQHVILVATILLGLLLGTDLLFRDFAYKLTFPNLEAYDAARVRLDEDPSRHDHYYGLLEDQAANRSPAPSLVNSEEPLRAMRDRWQKDHGPGSRPPLVIVAASGGGIRAAVWTAVVLEGLEREVPGLRGQIRLMTGASGGMVGAALYAADFENAPAGPPVLNAESGLSDRLSGALARDSLTPTVNSLMLHDLPALWYPKRISHDRGRVLEEAWHRNTRPPGGGPSPLERTFEDLKPLEREGKRPSLLFSPMLVEDARRLLVSNLDLLDLTWTQGDVLSFKPFSEQYRFPGSPKQPMLSLSAVEFFRLFPNAAAFQVGTAARMSATFPLVSPAVSLPTDPPRRVVDAGYYDNFGTNLAAMWLYRHREAVAKYTSGVVVIEIRAHRNGYARWHFQDTEAERNHPDPDNPFPRPKRDLLAEALEWFVTPAEAVMTAQERATYYRNDEWLHVLDKHFNHGGRRFFTTVAFECSVDASLSWTLPQVEAARIGHAFYSDPGTATMERWIRKRVTALKEWFDERDQQGRGRVKP